MIFNEPGAYYNAMDRGYHEVAPAGSEPSSPEEVPSMGLSPADIGVSTPPMQNQLEALKARIFQGASRVELGFMGRGKGSMTQGQTTPEMFGADERQDIKELAEYNKVVLTTHATPIHGSLAGLAEGGFSDGAREMALHEIERAVDFAADTTRGGPVVIHSQEFQRPISEAYGKEGFKMFEKEPERAEFYLVDNRTGRIITNPIRKDVKIVLPEWETDEKGNYKLDQRGLKIPVFDEQKGTFKMSERSWDYFEKEAKRLTEEARKKDSRAPEIIPAEAYYREQIDSQQAQAHGWAVHYGGAISELRKNKEKYHKALTFYEKLEAGLPEDEKWKLAKQMGVPRDVLGLIPPETKMPAQYLREQLKEAEQSLEAYGDMSRAYEQQAREIEITKQHVVPLEKYGIERAAETIARAGMVAMEKTKDIKKPAEPLFIAVENIFPEQYGGHPQELKNVVLKAREEMAQRLVKTGEYDEIKAKELASQHIKATLDIGHAYTWRKYFEGSDEDFKKWLFKQVDDLNKSEIIGHVHISDNFGWEDEHVTPGQGRVPIKEVVEKLKQAKVKSFVVEPAHQDYKALLGGWKTFGGPVYGISRRETWADIEHSYFGRAAPPYFLYGPATPSPEQWILWTGVQLE